MSSLRGINRLVSIYRSLLGLEPFLLFFADNHTHTYTGRVETQPNPNPHPHDHPTRPRTTILILFQTQTQKERVNRRNEEDSRRQRNIPQNQNLFQQLHPAGQG